MLYVHLPIDLNTYVRMHEYLSTEHLKLNTGKTEHLWKPNDRRGPTGVRFRQVLL